MAALSLAQGQLPQQLQHAAAVVVGVFMTTPTSPAVVGVAVPGAEPQQLRHVVVVVVVVVGVFAPIPTRSVVPGPDPQGTIQECLRHSMGLPVALLSNSAGWGHAAAHCPDFGK